MPIVCKRWIVVNPPPDVARFAKFFKFSLPQQDQRLTVVDEPAGLTDFLGPHDCIPQHFVHGAAIAMLIIVEHAELMQGDDHTCDKL
eukprot:COSAG02_NODE_1816_length_10778_cov_4.675812_2_plen_87_part_00